MPVETRDPSWSIGRRQVLAGGLAVVATASVSLAPEVAAATPGRPYEWSADRSENGWPIPGPVESFTVEGSDQAVSLAAGPAATVLLHVARRYHYEIDELRAGDLAGFSTSREVAADELSNYLSGTALSIRAGSYPRGVAGGFYPEQLVVIRDILAECAGVVAWGGDLPLRQESHFQLDVRPDDRALAELVGRLARLDEAAGAGAGATDAFDAGRRKIATRFHSTYRRRR